MHNTGPFKILFIINPISGGKAKQDWESSIREFFKESPHTIEFFLLDGKNDDSSVKHWIDKVSPHRVVAVGGDGTVSLVAKALLGSDIALAILPAGSANGMAKELDIPQTVKEGIEVIINGQVKAADVIRINEDRICLHLSDIGMNAKLVKYFEEGKLRGKWGYARVLLKVLNNKTLMHVIIDSNEEEIRRKAFMVVLANARKYGTGAVINPDGDLYDGLFEVIIIRRLALSEILKVLIRPGPFNPKKFEVIHAKHVSIKTLKPVHFQVDGEYLGKVDEVNAYIEEAKLQLVVPAKK